MKLRIFLFAMILLAAGLVLAEDMKPATHGMTDPAKIQWGPCPEGLPPGCKAAVLQGDPSKAGELFTLRAWMPNGYKIAPHFHPGAENLTVISGKFHLGMGDQFNKTGADTIAAGGFAWMGPEMHHFAWTEGETIIQVHAIGPFAITYLNAADDPRGMKK